MSWVTPPVLVGLGVSATATAASTFTTLGLGAVAPALRSSLHLTTAEVGLIPGLVSLGALAASVPAGNVTDRIGAGRSLTLAQLGVTAGVIIAVLRRVAGSSLRVLWSAGVGYGAVNPATNVLSTALVPRRRRALFLSVKQTGVTLGGLAAGLTLPRMARQSAGGRRSRLAIAVLLAGVLIGSLGCPPGGRGMVRLEAWSPRRAVRLDEPVASPESRRPRCSGSSCPACSSVWPAT